MRCYGNVTSSFDLSLGRKNSRISGAFPDLCYSQSSMCRQPQAGGPFPVSIILFFLSKIRVSQHFGVGGPEREEGKEEGVVLWEG